MALAVTLSGPVVGFCSQQDFLVYAQITTINCIFKWLELVVCLLLSLGQADDYDVLREGALV